MRKLIFASLIMLLALSGAAAQNRSDACHVYVVDVVKARKAFEDFHETGNKEQDAKALSVGTTIAGEFSTRIAEEVGTTRSYPFPVPGSKLTITATVYYTDESMASHDTNDSILVGILVSPQAQDDAIFSPDSAVAEVTHDEHTNKVRVKRYFKVRGRSYLVGLECDCKASGQPVP
jgi:hypothetical protein